MWVKTFVTSLGIATLGVGCAGIDNLIAQGVGKATEPKKESEEEYHWRLAMEKKAIAEKRPQVVDAETFDTAKVATLQYAGQIEVYVENHCEKERAARCDEAEALMKEGAQWEIDTYRQALAVPAIEFDDLQDVILSLERRNANKDLVIDDMVNELAKRKLDYWAGELSKRGASLTKYAEAKGEAICLPYKADPKASDTKGINFVFGASDTVWIKCVFTRPPSEFTRNDGDYWRVEIRWGSEWEDIKMVYDVAKPSTTPTVIFSFPADVVGEKIAAKADATNFVYPGHWLRIRASYTTRYITGQEWRDDKWVDVWKHEQMIGSSVFLKWK